MFKSKIFLIIVFVFILLTTAACVKVGTEELDGGVFKSIDQGKTWQQKKNLLGLPGENSFLNNVDVTVLAFDPQDRDTLYLGTKQDGVFVSFDAAETWAKIKKLPSGGVNSIAVHPRAKHIVYAAVDNQIFKSIDANRTWQNIYLEAVPEVKIKTLTIDSSLPDRIYAGLSDGRVIKSEDGGLSWQALFGFKGAIRQILINPENSQIIYVATKGRGVFRSSDRGVSWQSLDENLKIFPGGREALKLFFSPVQPKTLTSLSNYGPLKTEDGGQTWTDYKLLISGSEFKIQTMAVDPQNPDIIYCLASGILYKSVDGGKNWITKSLPGKRKPSELLIDPINTNILYLGVTK